MASIYLPLAASQLGVVSRRQLLDAGVPSRSISNAIAGFRLFPVYQGVYLVGRPQLSMDGLLMASLLVAGDGAALCSKTAAAIWGFHSHRNPVHVVQRRRGRKLRAMIRVEGQRWLPHLIVHQTGNMPATDLTTRKRLTLTRPTRSLWDCAAVLSRQDFRWAFMEADRLGLLDERELRRMSQQGQGRRGGCLFREAVARRKADIGQTRSLLEAIVLDLSNEAGIPAPQVNRKTHDYRPDFRWPKHGVLVEADGYEFHRGREAFENDVLRSNRLRAEGWTVLRFTWRMATEEPDEVGAIILRTLRSNEPDRKK